MAAYKRYRRDGDVSYSLGISITFELLELKKEYAEKVYVHSSMKRGSVLEKLLNVCGSAGVSVVYTDKIFNILSQKENCYVIGEFRKFKSPLDGDRPHIVLVNPSNAGNMGTIMRSALGFGINQIAIIRDAADVFDPKAVRASMGAIFSMSFLYFDSFDEYMARFGGRELYPFMLDAKKSLGDISPKGKYSLIFGNEAAGLPSAFAGIGTPVLIPHSAAIDSLNLSVAVGIAMYEVTKEEFKKKDF